MQPNPRDYNGDYEAYARDVDVYARERARAILSDAYDEQAKWQRRKMCSFVLAAIFALIAILAGIAHAALICRPGPAGSQICTEDTTPGQSASAPAYVVIVPHATPPPPLGPPLNPLTYRTQIQAYCRTNLSGCGPR